MLISVWEEKDLDDKLDGRPDPVLIKLGPNDECNILPLPD